MEPSKHESSFKGRGAQIQPQNRYSNLSYVAEHPEGLDIPMLENDKTTFYDTFPKKVLSYNQSPDLGFNVSLNPYQGCEHGCVYCYARNSHEYWGYGPGLDFERKILIKKDLIHVLEQEFNKPSYQVQPIVLSGNTDCYQPIERTLGLTRQVLKTMLDYRHPVSLITKNSLILRDLDLLEALAKLGLVQVAMSLNSLDENLRQRLEPRTTTASSRLRVIEKLRAAGIPVMLMAAPIIPGLNSDGIPELLKEAAAHGAQSASYSLVRLNGAVGDIFADWIHNAYPDRAEKVLGQVKASHGGTLNESRWGVRMKGEGKLVESIEQLFAISYKKWFPNPEKISLRTDLFVPLKGRQLDLFS